MTIANHKRTYPTHDGHDMVEIKRDEYQRLLKENKMMKDVLHRHGIKIQEKQCLDSR